MIPSVPASTGLERELSSDLDPGVFNRGERFAARFLGLNPETLRGWRKRGVGPKHKQILGKLVSLIHFLSDATQSADQAHPSPLDVLAAKNADGEHA